MWVIEVVIELPERKSGVILKKLVLPWVSLALSFIIDGVRQVPNCLIVLSGAQNMSHEKI